MPNQAGTTYANCLRELRRQFARSYCATYFGLGFQGEADPQFAVGTN